MERVVRSVVIFVSAFVATYAIHDLVSYIAEKMGERERHAGE